MIEFWFDGCCEPVNPGGHAACGTHVVRDGVVLLSEGRYLGFGAKMSNNVAEYSACIRALEFLVEKGLNKEPAVGRGDSNLVVSQLYQNANGQKWKVRGGIYLPYHFKAKKLFEQFTNIKLFWIPRDENDICDALSKDPLLKHGVKFRIQPV